VVTAGLAEDTLGLSDLLADEVVVFLAGIILFSFG
jgi:hypothetical protein